MAINSTLAIAAVIIAGASFALLIITTNVKVMSAKDTNTTATVTTSSSAIKAHAGGGNSTDMLAVFVPQQAQVRVGQSITWDNPSTVGEPHTVTFVLDNKTSTGIVSPFATVPNSTKFMPLPPGSNSEPVKAPGRNNVVIAANARSYIPTIIDSQGNVKHFSPNIAYTMTGNEQYINSGWLLPKGQQQDFPGSSNTFTVTFQKAGTYNYQCLIHPWMRGAVIVK
jgi:plastocyanin